MYQWEVKYQRSVIRIKEEGLYCISKRYIIFYIINYKNIFAIINMINIIIWATCHGISLEKVLKKIFGNVINVKRYANFTYINTSLELPYFGDCDYFIYEYYEPKPNMPYDLDFIIKNNLKKDCKTISFPYLCFSGYWPYKTYNKFNDLTINKVHQYGLWNSILSDDKIYNLTKKIINSDKEIEETELFNYISDINDENYINKEVCEKNLESTLSIIFNKETKCTVTGIYDFIKSNYKKHKLFHHINHPDKMLLNFVINKILHQIDELNHITTDYTDIIADDLKDICHPILPSVKKHLELEFNNNYGYNKHYPDIKNLQDFYITFFSTIKKFNVKLEISMNNISNFTLNNYFTEDQILINYKDTKLISRTPIININNLNYILCDYPIVIFYDKSNKWIELEYNKDKKILGSYPFDEITDETERVVEFNNEKYKVPNRLIYFDKDENKIICLVYKHILLIKNNNTWESVNTITENYINYSSIEYSSLSSVNNELIMKYNIKYGIDSLNDEIYLKFADTITNYIFSYFRFPDKFKYGFKLKLFKKEFNYKKELLYLTLTINSDILSFTPKIVLL
jgi:hypothetical protein